MTDTPIKHLTVFSEQIAFVSRPGKGAGVMWLGGWRSDMHGSKALHLDEVAAKNGFPYLRFDYSGHGQSSGHWSEGTISKWVAEGLAVFHEAAPQSCILVGSSMGAWITLRLLQELQKAGLGARIKGLILIAPAPDFTIDLIEPIMGDKERAALETQGWFEEKSEYLAQPNRWSKAFLYDGRNNQVLKGMLETHCPVHILQGLKDADVPHTHALKLAAHLPLDCVTMAMITDGDHRLSRPQDLQLLEHALITMLAQENS
jgi:pimeloyl-ACP methyl ester carboxylesterase